MKIKPVFIEATTLDDVYFKLLSKLNKYGREIPVDEGSYKGSTRLEFDYVSGFIKYPMVRPLAPIMPEGVDPVTTDEKIEEYFLDYLMNTKLGENEHYKYATWITGGEYKIPALSLPCWKHKNDYWVIAPDQLQWCIDHYRKKGFGNNHCFIQVGYPESNYAYDKPYESEADRGTSPCILPDSKILTIKGYKNAENIKEGEVVFTHNGNWKKVTRVYKRKYEGLINSIKMRGFNQELNLTPDHPIYCVKANICPYDISKHKLRCKPNCIKQYSCYEARDKRCKKLYNQYEENWASAKDLNTLYYIIIPKLEDHNSCPFSDEEMYLFGLWLAEGDYTYCRSKPSGLRYNLGTHEKELIKNTKKLFKRVYNKEPHIALSNENRSCTRISFYSVVLARKYMSLFGSLARNKKIPGDFIFYNKEKLKKLIEGYIDGDGYNRDKYRKSFYTSSKVLREMFSLILPKIGFIPSISISQPKDHFLESEGRWIKSNSPGYVFEFTENKKSRYYWEDDKNYYIPIRSNNLNYYNGLVYNYEVEDDNSYFANGFSVHNCLRGIDTKIIDNKLCFHVYFRSWDLYSAFPQNMGGIAMLLEYMAEMLEIETGAFSFSSLKLHCYKHAIIPMRRRLNIG